MAEHIIEFIEQYGYLAVAALMLLENVFPPIPSELIMPFAGYAAARGELSLVGVMVAGVAGSLLGAVPWYLAGRLLGTARLKRFAERHGRWLTLSPEDIDRAQKWFDRHGQAAVFFGRLLPAVRTLMSVPAGVAAMPWPRFLLWSGLGISLWTSALAGLGFALQDQHERIAAWLNPVSTAVMAACLLTYLWRVATFRHRAG
jgi:membrane protein DedA with SNARE-associated domain